MKNFISKNKVCLYDEFYDDIFNDVEFEENQTTDCCKYVYSFFFKYLAYFPIFMFNVKSCNEN